MIWKSAASGQRPGSPSETALSATRHGATTLSAVFTRVLTAIHKGKAEHVLSAFCSSLQTVLGHEASRSKGLEIPDALKLLERLDLRGKIVTGDAIFCQKSIAAKIVERGGDYVFPVKDNQKTLRQDIETAFNEPV